MSTHPSLLIGFGSDIILRLTLHAISGWPNNPPLTLPLRLWCFVSFGKLLFFSPAILSRWGSILFSCRWRCCCLILETAQASPVPACGARVCICKDDICPLTYGFKEGGNKRKKSTRARTLLCPACLDSCRVSLVDGWPFGSVRPWQWITFFNNTDLLLLSRYCLLLLFWHCLILLLLCECCFFMARFSPKFTFKKAVKHNI